MKFRRHFQKDKIEIIPTKKLDNSIVFYVKNGKGSLRSQYGSYGGKGLFCLTFDGIPLTKFHGDEYMCPTCEKLISAGYGLDKCNDNNRLLSALSEKLNAPFESIEKSFEDIKPLLGLLPTGYYLLSDEELFPTDGESTFFWAIGNSPKMNQATCPVYDRESYEWNDAAPKYIIPTQPPKLFNMERAKFYCGKENTRAIAYYLDGYLCALLDGHHKATAAALSGRPVKSLVITAAYSLTLPNPNQGTKGSINFGDIRLFEDELLCSFESVRQWFRGRRMTEKEVAKYLSLQDDSFDNYPWPKEILDSAKQFYGVYTHACLEWAGDLSDKRLDAIVCGKERPGIPAAGHIVNALYASADPRFIQFAIAICKNCEYSEIWGDCFSRLAKTNAQQVEDFFIDFLISDNRQRPWLTKIADDYLTLSRNDVHQKNRLTNSTIYCKV